MRKVLVIPAALAIVFAFIVVGNQIASVEADTIPSPSPSASASIEPTPTPTSVSRAVRNRCLDVRRSATLARQDNVRIRKCFLKSLPTPIAKAPAWHATEEEWLAAKAKWDSQRRTYRNNFAYLKNRMVSTKGGGALRWRPLIRWWWPEWSESQVYFMAHIIWHESSGSPYRWNTAGSGAFGLFQLLPKPSWVWGVWTQAKAARQIKYDHGGLAHWSGGRAWSCRGGCGIY